MIRPPCGVCAFIIRTAWCAHRNAPVRFVATIDCHCSRVSSSTVPAGPNTPALLNSRSMRPHRRCTASNSAATESGTVTSAGTTSTASPAPATVSRSAPSRLPATATCHPAASRAWETHRPSPDPAPVTTLTPVVAIPVPSPRPDNALNLSGGSAVQRARIGRDVHRVLLDRGQRDDLQAAFVGGGEHHRRGDAVAVGEQPVGRRHAPPVARHQPGKAERRDRGAQVVADAALVFEELGGDHRTDRVAPQVLRPGVAAAVPVETGHRIHAAGFEFTAQYVAIGHDSQYLRPGRGATSTWPACGPARLAPAGSACIPPRVAGDQRRWPVSVVNFELVFPSVRRAALPS